jgi:hypothetical protein
LHPGRAREAGNLACWHQLLKLAGRIACVTIIGRVTREILFAALKQRRLNDAPRILFAMNRDGLLSPKVAAVRERGTPTAALALTTVLAIALALTGTFESLFAVGAFMGMTIDASLDGSVGTCL